MEQISPAGYRDTVDESNLKRKFAKDDVGSLFQSLALLSKFAQGLAEWTEPRIELWDRRTYWTALTHFTNAAQLKLLSKAWIMFGRAKHWLQCGLRYLQVSNFPHRHQRDSRRVGQTCAAPSKFLQVFGHNHTELTTLTDALYEFYSFTQMKGIIKFIVFISPHDWSVESKITKSKPQDF